MAYLLRTSVDDDRMDDENKNKFDEQKIVKYSFRMFLSSSCMDTSDRSGKARRRSCTP